MAFVPESMLLNNDHHHHQDFQGVEFLMRRSNMPSFSGMVEESQPDDDATSDDGSQIMLGEKKRRLNLEQVKALEKSFELGNKLEPERKMQLARALGLQPRQVAIWFQNRRARWKTKQLERDYDVLKRQFEAVKANNDALKSQNKKLQTQLMALKKNRESSGIIGSFNLNKENEGCWSNGSGDENSCEVNLNTTSIEDNTLLLYPRDQSDKHGHVFFPNCQQLPQTSSGVQDQMCTKVIDHPNDGFCNVFGGIEGNPEYWPWSEQQNFS